MSKQYFEKFAFSFFKVSILFIWTFLPLTYTCLLQEVVTPTVARITTMFTLHRVLLPSYVFDYPGPTHAYYRRSLHLLSLEVLPCLH